ncbi:MULTISPECIES: DNA-binding protein [Pseudomonas]|uniref:DNA-binding protein n=1 Tax=Pseudomonas TaxID=286 RepID=UPI000C06BCB3|nr:cold-shock protein [Pseudomonas gessardii]PHN53870.1 hypothetical protein AO268_10015 [Pseudomonas sp. ICMP 8385]
MNVVTGVVKSYDQCSGDGLNVLDRGGDEVFVDRRGSVGIKLSVGLKVAQQMIHRTVGVYASSLRLI